MSKDLKIVAISNDVNALKWFKNFYDENINLFPKSEQPVLTIDGNKLYYDKSKVTKNILSRLHQYLFPPPIYPDDYESILHIKPKANIQFLINHDDGSVEFYLYKIELKRWQKVYYDEDLGDLVYSWT